MSDERHPDQPFVFDGDVLRFRRNSLVRRLLDSYPGRSGGGLNALSIDGCSAPREDWEQLYQLIGYSFDGYQDLSEVRPETIDRLEPAADMAIAEHEAMSEQRDRAEYERLKAKFG